MKTCSTVGIVVSAISLTVSLSIAQESAGPGEDARQIVLILGKDRSFSATMAASVQYEGAEKQSRGEKPYFLSHGNTRTEEDYTRKPGLQSKVIEALKKDGLAQMVMITRPDRQTSYLLIPGRKSYMKMDWRETGFDSTAKPPKIERKEIGKETIDGHTCVKVQLVMISSDDTKEEMTAWEATDLGGMIIRLDSTNGYDGSKGSLLFKNVKLGKLDPALFEVPTGFKEMSQEESVEFGSAMMHVEMSADSGAPTPPSKKSTP